MSLIIDGVEIPTNGSVFYNGTELDKIICNGVVVWEKITDIDVAAAIINGTLPYIVYHGPDSVTGNGNTKRIVHTTQNCMVEDNNHGEYNTAIRVSDGVIAFNVRGSSSRTSNDPSLSGDQYIQFSLDVTPFRIIQLTIETSGEASASGKVACTFSVFFNSTMVSSEYAYVCDHPWDPNNDNNQQVSGAVIRKTIDISSYTGVYDIKLNNQFYTQSESNSRARSVVSTLQFLS